MYKKKIPFDIECGVKITMEVMGGKWKSCILLELMAGAKRPSELHRHFTDASPRVIDQQLRELEAHGMISKKIFAELPPRSEYSITEQGKTLIPIIEQIEKWGDNFRPQMKEILGIEEIGQRIFICLLTSDELPVIEPDTIVKQQLDGRRNN